MLLLGTSLIDNYLEEAKIPGEKKEINMKYV